jgi:hypothetical protein
MTLPIKSNTTCDIYHGTNAPPAPPDAAGVPCHLIASYYGALEHGEGDGNYGRVTHIMLVDLSTDIRDNYSLGGSQGMADMIYVPNQNGTPFQVQFVLRKRLGPNRDYKVVYLQRYASNGPAWPTSDL